MNTERITQMEQRLVRAAAAVEAMETAIEQYKAAQDDLAALDTYLGSTEWHADRNDDKSGRLPAGLRRGVLSEDAIWNLLERNRELQKQIQGLS